ncbi:hypothetical protein [Vibrio mediterranei]|uniref:Uncharacterized protein n=1 Tax=Vibrio mediterranei TaxID=689 RepID=A0AAN1FM13_9VIBR|nr:hypothetical protein BSZ05_25795 [Vibrio mediterranei]KFA95252.1 hypothetical protein HW45_25825 [Vibrio sp. ER1A]
MFRLLKHSLLVTSAVPTLVFAGERRSSDRLKLGPQEAPLPPQYLPEVISLCRKAERVIKS